MRYLKIFEDYIMPIPPSLHKEEWDDFALTLENKFHILGLEVTVTKNQNIGKKIEYLEILIGMDYNMTPLSLLSILIGDFSTQRKIDKCYMAFPILKKNGRKYGKIKDGTNRIHSLKIIFSTVKPNDEDDYILMNPSTKEGAIKLVINEFLNVVNSCSDTLHFTPPIDMSPLKTITGTRHIINNYLKYGKLKPYDVNNLTNSILKSKDKFFVLNYLKDNNPTIFKLLKIDDSDKTIATKMGDAGF